MCCLMVAPVLLQEQLKDRERHSPPAPVTSPADSSLNVSLYHSDLLEVRHSYIFLPREKSMSIQQSLCFTISRRC